MADARVRGVMFTGSTEVARLIQRRLAQRLNPDGLPVPLIAETGGQNAMVVDSSALPEQVVADVIASAFDSAGQRCSALRILCLQEEIADRTLAMLHGAMAELTVGDPRRLSVDVGPVITAGAAETIARHVETMRARGHRITQIAAAENEWGTFVPPTLIEIGHVADVEAEVFGPVLHVLRYPRDGLDRLLADIAATGYGLTFGLHSRVAATVEHVLGRVEAGNVYVNRTVIGAVVGVQPFGGSGLSGTGPKAGGPLYLRRLLSDPAPEAVAGSMGGTPAAAAVAAYAAWLRRTGRDDVADRVEGYAMRSPLGARIELPGPVGESNVYTLRPRGRIAAVAETERGALLQAGAILATGNTAVVMAAGSSAWFEGLPADVAAMLERAESLADAGVLRGVLHEGGRDGLRTLARVLADGAGPILPIRTVASPTAEDAYDLLDLVEERSVSVNTAAAGGNASLMSLDG